MVSREPSRNGKGIGTSAGRLKPTAPPLAVTEGAARGARSVLRVPLFYKILVANAVLVLVVALASTAFAVARLDAGSWRMVFGEFLLIGGTGVLLTLPIHALILHFALLPLEALETVAQEVEQGDLSARAALSPLADPRLARLTGVLNRLLDRVLADRQRLREVAARAFWAQERERTRIARELEEEVAQTLSALLLHLRIARRTPAGESREDVLDGLRDGMAEVTDRIRDFAHALQPPALRDLGVVAAVEKYSREVAAASGISIEVEGENIRGLLAPDCELALYRILQEGLSNVVRHAAAKNVTISLARRGDCIETTLRDDGRGFSLPETEREHACLGLLGMRERALYTGGSAVIESAPGAGSRIVVRMPLASAEAADPSWEYTRLADLCAPAVS